MILHFCEDLFSEQQTDYCQSLKREYHSHVRLILLHVNHTITVCLQFQQYCTVKHINNYYFIKLYSKTKIKEQPCLEWHSQLNRSYHQRKLGHMLASPMLSFLLIRLKTIKKNCQKITALNSKCCLIVS